MTLQFYTVYDEIDSKQGVGKRSRLLQHLVVTCVCLYVCQCVSWLVVAYVELEEAYIVVYKAL